eukprot:6990324-Prymnesium_polylepis.1
MRRFCKCAIREPRIGTITPASRAPMRVVSANVRSQFPRTYRRVMRYGTGPVGRVMRYGTGPAGRVMRYGAADRPRYARRYALGADNAARGRPPLGAKFARPTCVEISPWD